MKSDKNLLNPWLIFSDPEDMILAANDDHFAGDRGSSHHHFSHFVSGKQFKRRTGLNNKYIAVFAGEVESSIRRHRRGAE